MNPFKQSSRASEPQNEINIILLGTNGGGRSLFINGIANYMKFNTLEDAMNSEEPVCLIPTNFSMFQLNENKLLEINMKSSLCNDDEVLSNCGVSCTPKPKIYRFETKSKVFNVLDTPPTGDTRGIEQDQKNVQMIMECLTKWNHVNMICLLFKVGELRVTASFRYCLEELLVNFHKNSIPNFAFVFTNSRSTDYLPGPALTTLQCFFEEHINQNNFKMNRGNVFCTDNEAIRLLYANYNGFEIGEHNYSYSNSWIHTANAIFNLFEAAAKLSPHSLLQTRALLHARQVIFDYSKMLVELNENNEKLQKIKNDETRLLNILKDYINSRGEGAEIRGKILEKEKYISQFKFEAPVDKSAVNLCRPYIEFIEQNSILPISGSFEEYGKLHMTVLKSEEQRFKSHGMLEDVRKVQMETERLKKILAIQQQFGILVAAIGKS